MEIIAAFAGLVLLAAAVCVLMFVMTRKRRLPAGAVRRLETMIGQSMAHQDPRMQIVELDKVLDQMLSDLGFKGSLGEKLKKGGARFPNINALWSVHKLRNTLAHEHGATASQADAQRMKDVLLSALRHVS